MTRLRTLLALLSLALSLALGASLAQAQDIEAPGPVGGRPAALPAVKLPDLNDIRLQVPRPVQAITAALGYGRQRLALVVGVGRVGSRLAIDSAPRDTQAVAAALRAGGFVVMLREDVVGSDLRAALKEFRGRLQPGGIGFAYFTGLGTQVEGQNLLLPRDVVLDGDAAGLALRLKAHGVPLQEVMDALLGTPESPRMLVVDAAYQHPALATLPKAGLAEQKLPTGMMALFGHALGAVQEVPAVAPLPEPPPTDPREIAASRFTRVLVSFLATPRISGAEALRGTAKAISDATIGQTSPWVGGDTDSREDFAEATLLDGILPRTPEDFAREALKQGVRTATRPGAARVGEQSVADVLEQSAGNNNAPTTQANPPPGPEAARPTLPDAPAGPSTLSTAVSAVGSVAGAVGTVASVAGTVAAVAAGAKVAEAAAAVSTATTVVSAVGSGLGNAVALASRLGSGSQTEQPARQVVQRLAAASPTPAAPVVPPAPANVPVAASNAALEVPPPAAGAAAPPATTPTTAPAPPPALAPTPPPSPPAAAAPTVAEAAAPAGAAPPAGDLAAGNPPPVDSAAATPALARTQPPPAPDGRTASSPEGGERPVYTPRTNSFGYAEGDTFTYQVIDTWKDQVVSSYTTSIDEVLGDGKLLANGHQLEMDPQGRIKSQRQPDGSTSQFEPVQELWWSKPKVGESRRVKFTESYTRAGGGSGQIEFKGSSSVGRLRKVETPAGEFEALPIETSGWFYETLGNGTLNSGQFSRTVWYAPKLGHPVAIDIQDADRLGKLLKRERVELMHAQQARSAP